MNKNKKLAAAFTLIFTAAATMAGAYALGNFTTKDSSGYVDLSEVDENKTAQKDTDTTKEFAKSEKESVPFGMDNVMDATDEYVKEDTKTAKSDTDKDSDGQKEEETTAKDQEAQQVADAKETESKEEAANSAEVMSDSAINESLPNEYAFQAADKLQWPVEGQVLMDYSMDNTVYFSTLDQYKYNPALIIGCKEGSAVQAAAGGEIASIDNKDETGLTVTIDMGNGYQAVYGQLAEVTCKKGDICKEGQTIGKISTPSRYYSKEGSNLYFQLLKDGTTINPSDYLPQ